MWVPPIYLQPCFDSDNENRLRGKWGCRSGSCRHGMELSIKFKLVCLHETNGNSAIIDRLCELWHLCVTRQEDDQHNPARQRAQEGLLDVYSMWRTFWQQQWPPSTYLAGEGGYDMKTNLLPILALKLLFIVLMVWFTEMHGQQCGDFVINNWV